MEYRARVYNAVRYQMPQVFAPPRPTQPMWVPPVNHARVHAPTLPEAVCRPPTWTSCSLAVQGGMVRPAGGGAAAASAGTPRRLGGPGRGRACGAASRRPIGRTVCCIALIACVCHYCCGCKGFASRASWGGLCVRSVCAPQTLRGWSSSLGPGRQWDRIDKLLSNARCGTIAHQAKLAPLSSAKARHRRAFAQSWLL